MTARSLMRAVSGSHEQIVAGMRDRVLTPVDGLGGTAVRVLDEPVFRRDDDGRLRQSVRLDLTGVAAVTRARVLNSGGEVDAVSDEGGLPATVRLFVPEVSAPQQHSVELEIAGVSRRGTVTVRPQRKWTVHLVHHSHLDIGYTDPQGMVLSHHLEFLDSVLNLADASEDWPDDARFRWNVEAAWPFGRWLQQRPADQVRRMVQLVRAGRVEVTAMPFNLHTEAASTDELHEQLRLVCELGQTHGFEATTVMQTDVPGATVGFVDALTDAGVRYLAAAHNWAGRSVPHLVGGVRLPRLFRWQAPSGRSLLVWLTDSPHGMAYMEGNLLGLAESFTVAADLLPAYLTALATQPYPYGPEMFGLGHLDLAALDRDPYPHDVLHLRVQGKFGDTAEERLTVQLVADGTEWIRTTISLPADVARVDITNRVAKTGTTAKESGFFSFPINLDRAAPEFEVTGGLTGPAHPAVPGSARHMRAIRHWAALHDADLSVAWATLEAPLVQLGDLHLPYAPFPGSLPLQRPEPGTLHSWVFNNVWDTNFPASQSGEMTFKYALSSDQAGRHRRLAVRTAAALTQPLPGFVTAGPRDNDAPVTRQLVGIDRDDVTVLGLGRGDDGTLAVKLQSLTDEPARVTVRLHAAPIERAFEGTLLGRARREIPVDGDAVTLTLAPLGTGCALLRTPQAAP